MDAVMVLLLLSLMVNAVLVTLYWMERDKAYTKGIMLDAWRKKCRYNSSRVAGLEKTINKVKQLLGE